MEILNTTANEPVVETDKGLNTSRRRFFQLAGGITGAGLLLAACRRTPPSTTFVGEGDAGLMNMLYIIEQVQAGFYTQAAITPFFDLTHSESLCFIDCRDQAIAHREYMKILLGKNAAKTITLDLSLTTFADRTSTLTNAYIIADIAVGAYNGAARLLTDSQLLQAISKIVTVQARRSAYMRDTLNYNSFGDNTAVDANGLDLATQPADAMALIQQYIQTKFDISKLPSF